MAFSFDETSTFCLIEALNPDALASFQFEHNEKYRIQPTEDQQHGKRARRSRRSDHPAFDQDEVLALTFETSKLNDPMRGHVFGCDDESCDVLLDYDNKRLISSQHFRIIFDWHRPLPDRLWLYDLSKNGTVVGETNVRELSTRRIALSHQATVRAGPVLLKISLPPPPIDDPLFMARWESYRQHALAATPKTIGPLKSRFDPTPDAISASNSVRGLSRNVYYPVMPLGSGASGRVFQVRRALTGVLR